MMGETLFTEEFVKEISSEKPNIEKIKNLIIQSFNKENDTNYDLNQGITYEQESLVIRWVNKATFAYFPRFFFYNKKYPISLPFISTCLSSKIGLLSQLHCPICTDENSFPISVIPIRIKAISKQASSKKKRQAFEKAIASRFKEKNYVYKKGNPLCVFVTFVLGKGNRNKDLDNMSKALLDALKADVLFGEDLDIEHLNLLKINWSGDGDCIFVNIRNSSFSQHENVLFKSMHNNWGGLKFLNLEDFMEK